MQGRQICRLLQETDWRGHCAAAVWQHLQQQTWALLAALLHACLPYLAAAVRRARGAQASTFFCPPFKCAVVYHCRRAALGVDVQPRAQQRRWQFASCLHTVCLQAQPVPGGPLPLFAWLSGEPAGMYCVARHGGGRRRRRHVDKCGHVDWCSVLSLATSSGNLACRSRLQGRRTERLAACQLPRAPASSSRGRVSGCRKLQHASGSVASAADTVI